MIGFPQRSQNENSGKPIPATIASLSCLISFLQLSHFLTSVDKEELCLHGLELCDTSLVFPQLVFMPAKLMGASYIFIAVVLDSVQNCIELGDGFVHFPLYAIDSSVLRGKASIHSLVLGCKAPIHSFKTLINGLKNHRSLLGKELLDIFGVVLL